MPIVPKRYEMPVQEPEVRGHNFGEVALGYDETLAVSEARRCLRSAAESARRRRSARAAARSVLSSSLSR